jgi:N-acetylglucosamine-6-sulfatase
MNRNSDVRAAVAIAIVPLALFACLAAGLRGQERPQTPPAASTPAGEDPNVTPPSCQPVPGTAKWWTAAHKRHFAEAPKHNVRVAMLGDSLIAGWTKESWQAYWAPRGAYNFGIPADRTEHVLWRIEQGLFDLVDPNVVVLQIGTNNLSARTTSNPVTSAGVPPRPSAASG